MCFGLLEGAKLSGDQPVLVMLWTALILACGFQAGCGLLLCIGALATHCMHLLVKSRKMISKRLVNWLVKHLNAETEEQKVS